MRKFLRRLGSGVAVVLVLAVVTVALRQNRTFDAPYPDIHASADPAVIERGRYLVTGPAFCTACHGEIDLAGGPAFRLPIGTIYAPNITPDKATGIGEYSDPEIARVLRYGVRPSGRVTMPFMPFTDICDDDLTAIVSYLRSRPPIGHPVPASDYNVLGRAAKAFVLEPRGPTKPIRARVARGPTVEYGEYLASAVANCGGCHTKTSKRTGAPEGVAFAGGSTLESRTSPGTKFVTPNLTPDPTSGRIYAWSEDVFVARFKNAVPTASPMPWNELKNLSEDDLRAVYRYLFSLPPAAQTPS
jgi:mono/diheme cytochrome c family protein